MTNISEPGPLSFPATINSILETDAVQGAPVSGDPNTGIPNLAIVGLAKRTQSNKDFIETHDHTTGKGSTTVPEASIVFANDGHEHNGGAGGERVKTTSLETIVGSIPENISIFFNSGGHDHRGSGNLGTLITAGSALTGMTFNNRILIPSFPLEAFSDDSTKLVDATSDPQLKNGPNGEQFVAWAIADIPSFLKMPFQCPFDYKAGTGSLFIAAAVGDSGGGITTATIDFSAIPNFNAFGSSPVTVDFASAVLTEVSLAAPTTFLEVVRDSNDFKPGSHYLLVVEHISNDGSGADETRLWRIWFKYDSKHTV